MQPRPGAQGTPVSPFLLSCFVPGPDHNGGQQLLMLTLAPYSNAGGTWPTHDPKAVGGPAASLNWEEKGAYRVQGPWRLKYTGLVDAGGAMCLHPTLLGGIKGTYSIPLTSSLPILQ